MRFSSRLPADLRPNSLTRFLEARRRDGAKILDLTESNPTKAGFAYPESLLASLADPRSLTYDPAPAGSAASREAVAAHYAQRGFEVSPDRILLTTSTSEAYSYLFKLLAGPGDEILVPQPSYPLFEFLANLDCVCVKQYPLFYHDEWSVDFDALEALVSARTRAIVVVNPNNPTGSFLKRDEVTRLLEIADKHDLAILSDEVFADYSFGPDPRRVNSLLGAKRAFSLSGLSKVSGLPQMKLGWIVGPESAIERLELIADTYLAVGTPVQHALPALLAAGAEIRKQIATRVCRNYSQLRSQITGQSSCHLLEAEGGWYATIQVPRVRSEEEWVIDLLGKHDVLAQPGFFYDFASEAFLVLSLLPQIAIFDEGLGRILEAVN